ncbi:MAG: hypothetical protein H7A38_06925 [Chlamydiales bacterium]|nr:hypothetical protein [Chlamydiales bacterium]
MKRFSQFILGITLLFATTTAFASGVYASFRDATQVGGTTQSVTTGDSLTYPTTDINVGGAITHTINGAPSGVGDSFTINTTGDYLIIYTVNDISLEVSGAELPQYSFDLRVNGVEEDRITSNMSSSVILSLKAGDVLNIQYVGQLTANLVSTVNAGITETNVASITFVKIDGLAGAAAASTCNGGLH